MSVAESLKSKRVAVLQSNYIPWKGYFDIIHDVDLFIFHDDVQYTKNDWRNRNRIKTPNGVAWLTIPVSIHGLPMICEVCPSDPKWARNHWRIIRQNYAKAPHFARYKPFFEEAFLGTIWGSLSELNQHLIQSISREFLGLSTQFGDSRDYLASGRKLEKLLDLLSNAEATVYVSGPTAKSYILSERFDQLRIDLIWKDYAGYPEYSQFFPPFNHGVSIIDLLFHVGPEAPYYIWGWRSDARI